MYLIKARDRCLERIVNYDADIKTSVAIGTFLIKQLKKATDAEQYDLMYAKLKIIFEELEKPAYTNPETGEEVYPSIELTIKIYELYQLAIKEQKEFVRPEEVKQETGLTDQQKSTLDQLSQVMGEYEKLG